MQKIPTLFVRDEATRRVVDRVTPGCEWAFTAAVPYRKWDGTAAMIRGGRLFKRYDARATVLDDGTLETRGPLPPGFEPCQDRPDPNTDHYPGWVPVGDGPADRWFREALAWTGDDPDGLCVVEAAPDGTYELCGPKVQGDPERLGRHVLIPHDKGPLSGIPTTFDGLRDALVTLDFEGIVWHGIDGSMCKLKLRDFGLKRRGGD